MRFLLDQNQSPLLGEYLATAGHDAVHARDRDMRTAPDTAILQVAAEEGRVVISADTDFGDLLAQTNLSGPSVLLIRRQGQRRASELAQLIVANLDGFSDDLDNGAIVVLDADRVRVRQLPIRPD